MRALKELARDIDRFTLESATRREVKNPDGSITIKRDAVPSDKGIPALRAHIRANWTIDEILHFSNFTRGGLFTPSNGGWTVQYFGYDATTAEGMTNLVAMFKGLTAEAWAYMGAHLYAQMKSDTPSAALMDYSFTLGGFTLRALVQSLPPNYAAKIDLLLKQGDRLEAQGEANGARLADVKADTGFVAEEERRRKKAREKAAGKAAKARTEAEEGAEEKPYARRIKEALDQVTKLVEGGKQVLAACRYVCKHYGERQNQKTGAVIPGGLNKMNGDPMKPETLRDYYRKRRKGKRKSK